MTGPVLDCGPACDGSWLWVKAGGRVWFKVCHFRLFVGRRLFGAEVVTLGAFGRILQVYSATMDVPHYWTADPGQAPSGRAGGSQQTPGRTAALIMWRTGLRVSEVLALEWRDLDYAGDPATVLVRKSKSQRARTVRLHP